MTGLVDDHETAKRTLLRGCIFPNYNNIKYIIEYLFFERKWWVRYRSSSGRSYRVNGYGDPVAGTPACAASREASTGPISE